MTELAAANNDIIKLLLNMCSPSVQNFLSVVDQFIRFYILMCTKRTKFKQLNMRYFF